MIFRKKSVCSICIKQLVSYVEVMDLSVGDSKSITSLAGSVRLRSIHPACAAAVMPALNTILESIAKSLRERFSSSETNIKAVNFSPQMMTGTFSVPTYGSLRINLTANQMIDNLVLSAWKPIYTSDNTC